MSYYDTNNQDHHIQQILSYLFDYQGTDIKKEMSGKVLGLLESLEIQSTYQLFSLIQDYLPHRAKLMFAAEDFVGKKEMLLEVIEHICQK